MKKYIVEYFCEDRTRPRHLTQISKSGRMDGATISFLSDGKKDWQLQLKNDLLNGIYKDCWSHPKNNHFTNLKKEIWQGIRIKFK